MALTVEADEPAREHPPEGLSRRCDARWPETRVAEEPVDDVVAAPGQGGCAEESMRIVVRPLGEEPADEPLLGFDAVVSRAHPDLWLAGHRIPRIRIIGHDV
jgi:hypothetical protein